MTKQDRNIMFMAILTLALIVAAGVRVLFGAVEARAAAAGDEVVAVVIARERSDRSNLIEDLLWDCRASLAMTALPKDAEQALRLPQIGMGANLPTDVLSAIRNWPQGLSAKERAIFSEGLIALILKPVRSLDMASLISPLSRAGVLLARLWRTARAQVWGWIQSVKKSLAKLPSHLFSPSPSPSSSPLKGEEVLGGVSLHKICILRL